MQHRLVEQN